MLLGNQGQASWGPARLTPLRRPSAASRISKNRGDAMSKRKVIYDFGSNNGDDLPYYLLKADFVVAVEANPVLTDKIKARFAGEIAGGRLAVENCVLSDVPGTDKVPFYVHKKNHVLSTFPRPSAETVDQYQQIELHPRTPSNIVEQHGDPYYIKVDIEHFDAQILRELFAASVKPPYISAEIHHAEVFGILVAEPAYQSFKLVDGRSVNVKYANHTIETLSGPATYPFPFHSAGPFGDDIEGPWLNADDMFRALCKSGLGWKDIHARRDDTPPHIDLT